ncbi:MAG: hypothetical protein SGI92_04940 [Bryobacteraceae bacterium]|nr:hypothetical protein [Bryobacteraceae bacterium]
MNCPVTTGNPQALLDYAARTAAPEQASVLARHMAICPECARFAEAQSQVWSALDAWDAEPVPSDFDERLYARIDAESRRSFWSRILGDSFAWKPAVSFAGALATVAVALVLVVPPNRVDQPSVTSPDTARAELDAEQVERALEDLEMLRQLSAGTSGGSSQAL